MSSDSFANLPTAEIKAVLVRKYRLSNHAAKAKSRIREILATVSEFQLLVHLGVKFINLKAL